MNHTFLAVLFASTLACVVTTIGIYSIHRYEAWGNRNAVYFMSFAAGVLITVSFIHIIPKASEMNANAPLYLLAGYVGLYLFNRFLTAFVCDEREDQNLALGLVPLIGIGLHSFIDGVVYSVTFNVGIFTGFVAAIGTVLHEFPEGIVTFLILKRANFPDSRAALYAFLAAALSTPLGTLVSFPFISKIDRATLGLLLSISAGTLVYVGATHLLPAVEKEQKPWTVLALALGILVAALIVLSKGS